METTVARQMPRHRRLLLIGAFSVDQFFADLR
jgi:hypothetical protein